MPLTGWACTDLSENLSVNNLKGDQSNTPTFNPPFFSLVNTFKIGLGLAGSLVGVIVNLLVVVAVRTHSRFVIVKKRNDTL